MKQIKVHVVEKNSLAPNLKDCWDMKELLGTFISSEENCKKMVFKTKQNISEAFYCWTLQYLNQAKCIFFIIKGKSCACKFQSLSTSKYWSSIGLEQHEWSSGTGRLSEMEVFRNSWPLSVEVYLMGLLVLLIGWLTEVLIEVNCYWFMKWI